MLSKAEVMKSANCISITGRRPISAMPVAAPTKPELGDGHVLDPPVAKLIGEALGHLERAAKIAADVLAHEQHIGVAAHLLAQRLADGRDVGQLAIIDFQAVLHRQSRNCCRLAIVVDSSPISVGLKLDVSDGDADGHSTDKRRTVFICIPLIAFVSLHSDSQVRIDAVRSRRDPAWARLGKLDGVLDLDLAAVADLVQLDLVGDAGSQQLVCS